MSRPPDNDGFSEQGEPVDAVLRRMLAHAPDADLRPADATRAAILRAAREAVAAPGAAAAATEPTATAGSNPRSRGGLLLHWLDRLLPRAHAPWGAALATVVLASFITLMWHGEPVPPGSANGSREASAPAAESTPQPPVPTDRSAPSEADGTASSATGGASGRALEAPLPAPAAAPARSPAPGGAQARADSADARESWPAPPPAPSPAEAEAEVAQRPSSVAPEAARSRRPAPAPQPQPGSGPGPGDRSPTLSSPAPSASESASASGPDASADSPSSRRAEALRRAPPATMARRDERRAAAMAAPAPPAALSGAGWRGWTDLRIAGTGASGPSQHLERTRASASLAAALSGVLDAASAAPTDAALPGAVEWRVTLEREGRPLGTLEVGAEAVRWHARGEAPVLAVPAPAALQALRQALSQLRP